MRLLMHPAGKVAIGTAAGLAILALITFTYYYVTYSRLIDSKLKAGPFQSTSMVFAAPRVVSVGDEIVAAEIVAQLRRSGYGESSGNRMGWYHVRGDGALEIFPGTDSYFDDEAGVVKFEGRRVARIISLRDNTDRMQYLLEPELITNLSDRNREKRRLVRFDEIPKVLVHAVVSAEDKRFFQHAGFDPLRILKVAYVDLRERRLAEGASTLSMQLARLFFLDLRKTWKRKTAEVLITLHLEQKLSKEQIFEYYANQIPLGRRGSFAIHGFGEAARAYFGKDLRALTVPEAATLAGIIQRPSAFNPHRHPERVRNRRNVILALMRDNGYLSEEEFRAAAAEPLRLAPAEMESTEAPYFVDLVNYELQSDFADHDFQSSTYRVYTTIDMNLQRAAAEAVRIGLEEVDQRMSKRRWAKNEEPAQAQVALIALDPETGAVKALVGGRNYGASQLNRVLARRQPGSVFKPFVYAAALNTAVAGGPYILTPSSRLMDEPTTFWYNGKPYAPSNYKHEYRGEVTIRQALARSMNIPTVKLAEMIGYEEVEMLAKRAGMSMTIRPTPAIALGAYEVTPLEVAGAYTIFANEGTYVKPNFISLIRDRQGTVLYSNRPERQPVLDARVAYQVTSLMEEVMRSGTGAGARSRGFVLPAAGKTGTSHDGWFAGFTSQLICVVWVGIDDNRELRLEGAHSAMPIWTEFMKRAHQYREYRNARPFTPPDGILSVEVDALTGQLATAACPAVRVEYFVSGTQPVQMCRLHGAAPTTRIASWEAPAQTADGTGAAEVAKAPTVSSPRASLGRHPAPPQAQPTPLPEQPKEKKKGLFRRIWGVFK